MKKIFNTDLNINNVGEEHTLYGWVSKIRNLGSLVFVDLRDRSGIMQVVFNDTDKALLEASSNLKNEYCIKVVGIVNKRSSINPNMPTGEIELIAKALEILSTSIVLPFNINDENVSENLALKYRYLELRKERLQKNLIMRSKICSVVRNYLDKNGFIEIETPMLCRSTPEGARDYVVPSRINKGTFYALPQSPQIFKQLLMIGGFERYYQIAKCFRDEDLRADRQPEFTQIDMEMSFANEEDVFEVAEGMLREVVYQVKGITLDKFPRITYRDAMNLYGTDKPDTRYEMLLHDVTHIFKDTAFTIFDNAIKDNGVVKCIKVDGGAYTYTRKEIDYLTLEAKKFGAKALAWLKYEDNSFTGGITKNIEEDKLEQLKEYLNINNNDIVFFIADKLKVANTSLGGIRINIARKMNLIDKDKLNFLWVVDFPMFEYSESENRFIAAHHPFTMPESLEALDNKETCLARSYDIVINGYELASGSVRIHDANMQKQVFEKLGLTDLDIKRKFGFFVDAFKYGAPPHAGIAPGLDRLTMVLMGTENIKDVIAFPKIQNASDLMSEAPNVIDESQLEELSIKLK